ncbi:DUF1801 domain-containing protein [Candidatus Kapabacteria bacterium]|nr:DUF1801 domain-containing protein [Candidatus Kapabacteria bacterium]
MNKLKEVDQYIKQVPTKQSELLGKLRSLILETVPKSVELFKWGQLVYATEKNFVYLKSNKNHINLGFFNFDKISDPSNLLEGTGKSMRHIKISNIDNFDINTLKEMIKQASKF